MEIERKFLVNISKLDLGEAEKVLKIKQGYLSNDIDKVVRVRVQGNISFMTIKGHTNNISREEIEFVIPTNEAEEILQKFCSSKVLKTRYIYTVGEHIWEVDVFSGDNEGLIIAEIELSYEEETFEKPEWILEEVSHDPKYFNSNLISKPFSQW